MFSGLLSKYVNLDPFSTHHILNKFAYHRLFRKSRFCLLHFPSLSEIQAYAGYHGPDGLWLREQMPTSQHAYNPENDEGHALSMISKEYDVLQQSLPHDRPRAARAAAYLSHFIVDALDPAHHIGRLKSRNTDYDDWADPFLDVRQSLWANLRNRHFFFELCSAFYLWRSQHLFMRLERRRFRIKQRQPRKMQLLSILKRRVHYIHRFRIYERFFIRTSRPRVKGQIISILFPMMIRSVSLFWMSAMYQAQRSLLLRRK